MTRFCNAIVKWIRREKTQLDLDGGNRVNSMRLANCLRANFTKANATDFPLFDKFRKSLDGSLDRDFGIDARHLEDVDLLRTI